MNENGVAKTLRIIGIIEAICGVILGFIVLANGDDFAWVGIAIAITSFITCMLFVGFAEVISLLQKNVNKQDEVLDYLKNKPNDKKSAPKTMLQDIEDNLPSM